MNVDKLVPEGVEGRVPYKGSAGRDHPAADGRRAREHGLHRLRAPSRSCAPRPQFVEITSAGMRESHVHDVQITKEAPELPRRIGRDAREDPDPRFRRAVHAAHRAPRARGEGLLRDPSRTTSRDDFVRGFGAEGHHPLRQPHVGLRGVDRQGARRRCSSSACRCSASATACRPWRSSSAARSRPARCASSATPRCARAATRKLLDGIEDSRTRRGPRHAQGLDEPRRQGHRAAAGLQADGLHRRLPDRRHGRRGARASTRVQFHPEVTHTQQGTGDPAPLRARHLRLRAATGTCRDYVAEAVATHPRAGRQRRGDPRPVRRRRFVGRRGADPQGDRRPAHLRVRRPRPAAPERGEAGDGDLRASTCT